MWYKQLQINQKCTFIFVFLFHVLILKKEEQFWIPKKFCWAHAQHVQTQNYRRTTKNFSIFFQSRSRLYSYKPYGIKIMRVQKIENLTLEHIVYKIRSRSEIMLRLWYKFQESFHKIKSYPRLLLEYSSRETIPISITLRFGIHRCSTTGKPTRSFATERVSLDSV